MVADECLRRTAITRLSVSDDQAALLEETIDSWRDGANIAATVGWHQSETGKRKLQSLAYERIRDETDLGSQHAILACFQAAAALKGITAQRESSHSRPEFTAPTVRYDANTMTLFDDNTVSLSTTENRIRCDLCLPNDECGYQDRFLNDERWELTESTLSVRNGEYFLHLGFRRPKPDDSETDTAENRTVLGVDLGIENLAVTSTAHFESGQQLLHEHRQFEQVRSGLQATGTQSAHRTLVQRGSREERYNRDFLHNVSNRILAEAVAFECTHIAFEDLNHIRESLPKKRKFHQWAHRQLVQFVKYKADALGIAVEFVNPQNTSRRCCDCGHTNKKNRTDRDHFECTECGATANADYNAAKNVGWRFVRCGLQDSQRTGDGQLALKSGTVKPNRGFVPYSEQEIEVESTDKLIPTASERATAPSDRDW